MSIWLHPIDLESLNNFSQSTLLSHLGIIITNSGDDYLEGTMPVDDRTVQPYRLLHGGASCVLAESLGSIAASLCIDNKEFIAVGQHIEATHIRSATKGLVTGRARAIHLGRSSQIWRIEILNEDGKMICDSKLIMAIVKKK
ncbi:MAG: hotdog fold thioesterase [Bacteriovorax sp.]|nr:hotdog fold thioesterase [Bacteriovorax sp.]